MKYLIFIAVILLNSCSFFSESSTIIIKIQDVPEHWINSFPDLRLLIKYPDIKNNIIEEIYPPGTTGIEVQYKNMAVMPVAAYLITDSFTFPPAGGIYPYSTDILTSMQLNWEYGITADILITLIYGGMELNSFNTERLFNEIILRAPPDPFKLNKYKIIDGILSGEFRVTDIKSLEEEEVIINLSSGIWFTESPFSELINLSCEKEVTISLTYGFHILHNAITGNHYNIYIDESGYIID